MRSFSDRALQLMLGCGAVAGVLVPVVLLADAATRPDFNVWRNGVSQLGLGERGWLQTLNFVVGGLLLLAFAAGVRRFLSPGRGGTWGPIVIGAAGAALVVAGLVPTDPALGYPPGAPEVVSVSGRVHNLAGLILFAGLSAACFVLARHFGRARRGWSAYCGLTGVLVAGFATAAGIAYRLDVAGVLTSGPAGLLEHAAFLAGFGWIAALALQLLVEGTGPAAG